MFNNIMYKFVSRLQMVLMGRPSRNHSIYTRDLYTYYMYTCIIIVYECGQCGHVGIQHHILALASPIGGKRCYYTGLRACAGHHGLYNMIITIHSINYLALISVEHGSIVDSLSYQKLLFFPIAPASMPYGIKSLY